MKITYLYALLILSLAALQPAAAQQAMALTEERDQNAVPQTIGEKLTVTKNHPLLAELMKNSGLTAVLSGPGPYTFFAPTEEALQKIKNMSPDQLRNILSYHIVEGRYAVEDLKEGAQLKTLHGSTLTVIHKKGRTLINGVAIIRTYDSPSNGTAHLIENVMMPAE